MLTETRLRPHQNKEKGERIWADEEEWTRNQLSASQKALGFFNCLSHFSNPVSKCQFKTASENQGHKCPTNHFEHDSFCRGFSALSKQEKEDFFIKVMQQFRAKKYKQGSSESSQPFKLQFDCLVNVKSCMMTKWESAKATINFQLKKLYISNHAYEKVINLRLYIPRRSNSHYLCMALEFVGPVRIGEIDKLRIKFQKEDSDDFLKFERALQQISAEIISEKFIQAIKQQTEMEERRSIKKRVKLFTRSQNVHKIENAVWSGFPLDKYSTTNESELDSQQQISNVGDCSEVEPFRTIKQDQRMSIKVSEINKQKYRFRMQMNEVPKGKNICNFLAKYKSGHKMIFKLSFLEESKEIFKEGYPSQTVAVYQKLIWNQKIYSEILVGRQQNVEFPTPNNISFAFYGVDSPSNVSFTEKMHINCRELPSNQFQIDIQVIFSQQRYFKEEAYVYYLQCFKGVFSGLQVLSQLHSDTKLIKNDVLSLFQTEINSKLNEEQEEQSNLTDEIQMERQDLQKTRSVRLPSKNLMLLEEQSQVGEKPNTCLKHHHQVQPSQQKNGVLLKEHFLWGNWRRSPDGGLVCSDDELVDRQKKLARIVLKKFGQTILKGKNIINFSLPVVVFKKESHLESIARTYLYSPVFTEKAATIADPLERMKYAIIIMMTQNALSIHMEKPFNPILGQTYQGWIDGCPIYLEQISHHPPVSAYYMLGRGYKKYGSIEPRISIGLNKGSGFSLNPHIIEFDDGMKIQYICAKIVIGGMLVGDRTFKFQDKIYAYDRKHRFFASMKFGPIEEGFFSSSSEPQDFFSGYIYEVTPEFQIYFNGIMPRPHPEEKHIVKKLAYFDGIWNSYVNINKQEVVNFTTDMPYLFQIEKNPLPSDSRFREDLIQLLKGDLQKAQEEKQRMEQEQRRDQKLREENEKALH